MTTMLVASGGGHLQQLHSLIPRLGLNSDVIWATPDSGLAQHLLRDEKRIILPYIRSRDWRGATRMSGSALRLLRRSGATRIISTGAAVAPPFFLAGEALGLEMHYIESATRSQGPSLSGRLVSMVPTARLYSQYPDWAGGRWRYAGSIFDPYTRQDAPGHTTGLQRIVVTLGTEAFGFRRALEKLLEVLPDHAEILWQTGGTDATGLGIEARASVPGDELRAAMAAADLVVSHAGTGSALTAFDLGKTPLILPRESKFTEHVDNHQLLTAKELQRRGLAVAVPVGALAPEHLELAMTSRVVKDDVSRPFELAQDSGFGRATIIDLRARAHAGLPNGNRKPATTPPGDRTSRRSPASPAATGIDLTDAGRTRAWTLKHSRFPHPR